MSDPSVPRPLTAKTIITVQSTNQKLILAKRLPERRGCNVIEGIDPQDGGLWDIRITDRRIKTVADRGKGPAMELGYIVPWVLRHPAAIFQGVREEGEAEWLCYCAIPQKAFRKESGQEIPPYPDEVYLVFVDADRIAYNARWEKCDQDNPKLPEKHETRFIRRWLG